MGILLAEMAPEIALFALIVGGGAVLGIMILGFHFWMIRDCLLHEPKDEKGKRTWLAAILLFPPLGAAAYCLIRRPRRRRDLGI